jgi:hypothetical protein
LMVILPVLALAIIRFWSNKEVLIPVENIKNKAIYF